MDTIWKNTQQTVMTSYDKWLQCHWCRWWPTENKGNPHQQHAKRKGAHQRSVCWGRPPIPSTLNHVVNDPNNVVVVDIFLHRRGFMESERRTLFRFSLESYSGIWTEMFPNRTIMLKPWQIMLRELSQRVQTDFCKETTGPELFFQLLIHNLSCPHPLWFQPQAREGTINSFLWVKK